VQIEQTSVQEYLLIHKDQYSNPRDATVRDVLHLPMLF